MTFIFFRLCSTAPRQAAFAPEPYPPAAAQNKHWRTSDSYRKPNPNSLLTSEKESIETTLMINQTFKSLKKNLNKSFEKTTKASSSYPVALQLHFALPGFSTLPSSHHQLPGATASGQLEPPAKRHGGAVGGEVMKIQMTQVVKKSRVELPQGELHHVFII